MGFFTGVLDGIDYHQFYLVADSDDDVFPTFVDDTEIEPHGLIAPSDHAVCVVTGIAMGAINLTIDVLPKAPPVAIDDTHDWTAVSEVSFEATSATAWIHLLMEAATPPFNDLIVLPHGEGWYRIRAHAVGRELDYDGVVHDPREHHLLQLWKTDGPEPASHVRIDDRWANQGQID